MVPVTAHPDFLPDKYKSHYKSHVENGSGVPIIDASSMKTFLIPLEWIITMKRRS